VVERRQLGRGRPALRRGGRLSDTRAFYEAGYSLPDAAEAQRLGRWRALGARSKAAHVRALCARAGLEPASLVEIGCGDGALLAELRGLAPVLDGFELSAPAAEMARRHVPEARRIEPYDGERVPAADGAYDLAVLSHVLEHVPDPAPLLAEAARVARWVLVEVPLEANRSAARPAKRAEAARIGHLHAFDRAAVRELLAGAGLVPVADLADPLPFEHHAFFAERPRARLAARAKWAVRSAAHRLSPRAAERLFTVHYAALAGR
jgi:SAM-dependent methyltransferase